MFLYLLSIYLPFHFVWIALFGVAFLCAGSLWFLLLWRLLPVDAVGLVACQSFLVREACIGVLVDGAGSLVSGVQ